MIDQTALAYVNLHGILGVIPMLCKLDSEANKLIQGTNVSIGFDVKGGPSGTLIFKDGECRYEEGIKNPKIKLPFSSPEKFNGMIDGTVTPVPSKGFTHIGFLLKKFMPLTDILTKYLRASEKDLKNEEFFKKSTELMLYVIAGAIAQLGNNDPVSRASASYIADGKMLIKIIDGPSAMVIAENHKLKAVYGSCEDYRSYMSFADINVARDLFDGKINAVAAIGTGDVRVGGMVSQMDNVNRILDRVALYLA